jgi:Leucine-rich repeat (LRR) protein
MGDLSNLTALILSYNGLTGSIPGTLGNLASLEQLTLTNNQLSGSIPSELGNISSLVALNLSANPGLSGSLPYSLTDLELTSFIFSGTALCEPRDENFQNWLSSIPNLSSTGVVCPSSNFCSDITEISQVECEALVALYNSTDGANWTDNTGWLLVETPCTTPWHGLTCNQGHVTGLDLRMNQLTGSIPPELGNLASLENLVLSENQLTGSIPASLGGLSQLGRLHLYTNQLSGEIPPELGGLSNLDDLLLADNQLTGGIPAELGNMTSLNYLYLGNNQLTGSIPVEFGALTNLINLSLEGNPGLAGPLPSAMTNLTLLDYFHFYGTALCEPGDITFQFWINDITDLLRSGITCASINTSGGELDNPDGSVNVVVPEGALSTETLISITDLGSDYVLGDTQAVSGINIGPDGTEFDTPVTITMSWPDSDGDGFVDTTLQDENVLFISKDGEIITDICANDPGCDTVANTFTIEVVSLSDFVLGGSPGEITGPPGPVPVETQAEIIITFFDNVGTHNLTWDWGDGEIESKLDFPGNLVLHSHVYQFPGVYTVKLTIDEDTDKERSITYQYIVVYDPDGGFVTGGGWIMSHAGAYVPDPDLTGKATFGFVSKYKQGDTTPTGNTEFQFKVANLNFQSTSYEWLVVTGSDYAKFKGTGTINGGMDPLGNVFKFLIWAGDGDTDTFRIKIWWEEGDNEIVVYDNGMDQEIGGGNIVVHTAK